MEKKLEILGISEVAELLMLDPQTVSRKAQRGQIPGFKIGNRWRFRLSDINDWIDKKIAQEQNKKTRAKSDVLLKRLSAYFKERSDISLAYLFGSKATGGATEKSDLDIAIFMKDKKRLSLDIKSEIASDLMSSTGINRIDIVFLNNATPLMSYEVIRDGKIIFLDSKFDIFTYKISVLKKYQDTEYLRNIKFKYFLDAINQ